MHASGDSPSTHEKVTLAVLAAAMLEVHVDTKPGPEGGAGTQILTVSAVDASCIRYVDSIIDCNYGNSWVGSVPVVLISPGRWEERPGAVQRTSRALLSSWLLMV